MTSDTGHPERPVDMYSKMKGIFLSHPNSTRNRKSMAKLFCLLAFAAALLAVWSTVQITDTAIARDTGSRGSFMEPKKDKGRNLVILIGSLRCGEIGWKTLHENVLDVNNADLALVLTDKFLTKKYKKTSLYKRAKYIWKFKEYNDWGDALDTVNGTSWRTTILPRIKGLKVFHGILGGVNGLPSSGAIQQMMRYWTAQKIKELKLTEKYDRFVVSRNDQYYMCPYDFSNFDKNSITVPLGEDWGGICDRHFVAGSQNILAALDVLPTLLNNEFTPDEFEAINFNEHLLKATWDKKGLNIARTERHHFTCFDPQVDKTNTTTTWWKVAGGQEFGGVSVKYETEYWRSKMTCASKPPNNHSTIKENLENIIEDMMQRGQDKDFHVFWLQDEQKKLTDQLAKQNKK